MFSCKKPKMTTYTASFTIVGMAYMSSTGDNATSPTPDSNDLNPDSFKVVMSNTTSERNPHSGTVTLLPSYTASSTIPASSSSSVRPSSTVPPISPEDEDNYLRNHRPGAKTSDASASALFRVDYERLKFRLVFIMWPAVIGLTMAL